MNTLKNIGTIVAGFAVVVILSTATDTVLEAPGVFPQIGTVQLDTWMLAVALLYRMIYTVAGGYVVAWLAPSNPMKFVWILAILGFIAGCAGVIVGWNLSAHWYPILIALTSIPCVWWGGKLRLRS